MVPFRISMFSDFITFNIFSQTRDSFAQSDLDANRLFYTDNQYRNFVNPKGRYLLIRKRDFIDREIFSLDELASSYAAAALNKINRIS